MHARLTENAKSDLAEIKDYLEPRSLQGLDRILAAIFVVIGQLEDFPFLGHEGRIPGTREIVVPRSPFIVIYRLNEPYYIDVLNIVHGRQQYPPEG